MSDVKLYSDQINPNYGSIKIVPPGTWLSQYDYNASSKLSRQGMNYREAFGELTGYNVLSMGDKRSRDWLFSELVSFKIKNTGWIFDDNVRSDLWLGELIHVIGGVYLPESSYGHKAIVMNNNSYKLWTTHRRQYHVVKVNNNNTIYRNLKFDFGWIHKNTGFQTSDHDGNTNDCTLLHKFVCNDMKRTITLDNVEVNAWSDDDYVDTKAIITVRGNNNVLVVNIVGVVRGLFNTTGNDNLLSLVHLEGHNNTVIVNVCNDSYLMLDTSGTPNANATYVMTTYNAGNIEQAKTNKLFIIGGDRIVSNSANMYGVTGMFNAHRQWEINDRYILGKIPYSPDDTDEQQSRLPRETLLQPNVPGSEALFIRNVAGRHEQASAKFNATQSTREVWGRKTDTTPIPITT